MSSLLLQCCCCHTHIFAQKNAMIIQNLNFMFAQLAFGVRFSLKTFKHFKQTKHKTKASWPRNEEKQECSNSYNQHCDVVVSTVASWLERPWFGCLSAGLACCMVSPCLHGFSIFLPPSKDVCVRLTLNSIGLATCPGCTMPLTPYHAWWQLG